MGIYLCKSDGKNWSNGYKSSTWYKKNRKLRKQKMRTSPSISYDLSVIEIPIPLAQLIDQSEKKDVFHNQSLNPYSSELVKTKPQRADFDTINSSSDVQFLLIDLEKRMNRTSIAMLHILKPLMGDQLVMVKNLEELQRIRSKKRLCLFIFTSAEYADSLEKTSTNAEKVFVLGTSIKPADKTFENIQDLIFQVAEEYAQWCKKQAYEHEKLGEFTLATSKHETISNMYRRLMDISIEEITIDSPICTDTSIIWLTQNRNTANEEKLFQISPSLIVFNNDQTCWDHVIQCNNTAIFLLVDPNLNYDLSLLTRLEGLTQVKHLYRTEKFLNINKLCFRLTHDLIKHYGQLGDQLKTEGRNQEAQQMFLRARQLCQILF